MVSNQQTRDDIPTSPDINEDSDENYEPPSKMKPYELEKKQSTKYAFNLVKQTNMSTNKAAKVCKQLFEDGIQILTPPTSGVYKASIRVAKNIQKEMKETLRKS